MKKNKITYAITCCIESDELDRLLNQLSLIKDIDNHQILIQYDIDSVLESVMHVIYKYSNKFKECKVVGFSLNRHFANYKNNLFNHAIGDWILQIDADEYLEDSLCNNLSYFLDNSDLNSIDVILLPRINIVKGITKQHIYDWGWTIIKDEKWGNIINPPDYQWRLYRNKDSIRWINAVHEVLNVDPERVYAIYQNDWALIHIKDIQKQEMQNNFYSKI